MRIWRVLRGKIISGQAHGIDKVLIHRPVDNVILWCPACPEPGFNDLGIVVTRPEMRFVLGSYDLHSLMIPDRHLNQLQVTLDGNHHMNLTSKNTNPNDISLMGASAYFPLDTEYNNYLEKSPNPQTVSGSHYVVSRLMSNWIVEIHMRLPEGRQQPESKEVQESSSYWRGELSM